jgi:excisionase family DNA binding protein
MPNLVHHRPSPTLQEAAIARASSLYLAQYAQHQGPLTVRIDAAAADQPIQLPAAAVALLLDILQAMGAGQGVTVVAENAELTTMQAADILNVSRPFFIKLLDENAMPYRKVGKHRRVQLDDLLAYKLENNRQRQLILNQLTVEAQLLSIGY